MAKVARKMPEAAAYPNPEFGRIKTLPAVIYEGPTRLIYRIWAHGAAGAILRVQADDVVRTLMPSNSVDVVGKRISVKIKSGDVSCEYQYLGRDE